MAHDLDRSIASRLPAFNRKGMQSYVFKSIGVPPMGPGKGRLVLLFSAHADRYSIFFTGLGFAFQS